MTTANATATPPEIPAEAFLIQQAFGALITQALYVAAKLGIADLLAEQPQTIEQLASATHTQERALYRVLRSLASIGVFQETAPKVFALTPYAEPLRTDAPNSMHSGMIFMGESWHWQVWGQLLHSVETGTPAWGHVHGAEVFDYFSTRPTEAEIFNRAMTDMSVSTAPAVIAAYDFSAFTTLVDIAGGHGYLLAQILKANPQLKGVLFDVPSVIAGAAALLEQEGVTGRVETVAGNFFASVPANADAYIMKHIIHDWDDEQAAAILRNIRKGIHPDGKVLLVETVVPEGNESHYSKLLDLEMLVSPGGIERTAGEYRDLFAAAGFKLTRIVPTPSPYSVIEAVPE
ncbi:MAG: methyltransferase [Acidobacteria bacterium]|nr:methyltransferase [Acidobacteriota bacterium]